MTPMPLVQILHTVEIDGILYAKDQVVLIDNESLIDVLDQGHGDVVDQAPVWVDHSCRLATEFGSEPPWTGCVSIEG